ncbi:MAG: XRE family transcriptional regulator [Chloroflexota bacterium]
MSDEGLPFQRQFSILLETVRQPDGQPYSTAMIARATGLSEQSLLYLLDGRSVSPRLDTLRRLCHFYDISLDYFDCETEESCRAYLAKEVAGRSSALVRDIAQESETLTSSGQRKVLVILEWVRRARLSRKH